MLHVHCGDASAEILKQTDVPGEVIVWCDPLCEGPLPAGVSAEAWDAARAASLATSLGDEVDESTCARWLNEQQARLDAIALHDEVVLWFDACLFDQLILIRHLDWFSRQAMGSTRLSLICIGEHPDVPRFLGLGQLGPGAMAALFDTRHAVTREETETGVRAWEGVTSPDPRFVERFLDSNSIALPYVAEAMHRHLQRFPFVTNGLDRLEREVLEAIAAGRSKPPGIFVHAQDVEERPYFGDTMVWACIDAMACARHPLVHVEGPGRLPRWNPPPSLGDWDLSLTDTGRAVLEGREDAVSLNGIDRWIGGVHLAGDRAHWRWDDRARCLVESEVD